MSVMPLLSRWARSLRFASSIVMSGTRRQSQLQYIGDTRIQALISMYLTGDDRLVRQAISHFDASRIPEGITASRYPSDLGQYIPTFSLIWVAMVHDYWMHRDDAAYVRGLFQALQPADEHDGGPGRRGSRHEQRALMERVLDDHTLVQSTYYYSFYVLEALRKAGLTDRYIEQL